MQYLGRMAAKLGRPDRAHEWWTRSRSVSERVDRALWNAEEQFYYDRYLADGWRPCEQ